MQELTFFTGFQWEKLGHNFADLPMEVIADNVSACVFVFWCTSSNFKSAI
jgi:hypothetical protein